VVDHIGGLWLAGRFYVRKSTVARSSPIGFGRNAGRSVGAGIFRSVQLSSTGTANEAGRSSGARVDLGHCQWRNDSHRTDRSRPRRHRQRHGGRGLRLGRVLRCRECAWCDRRGATDQDGQGLSTETAVECSRSRDPEAEEDRSATVEEGIRLPSAGPHGERLLPVQVDHRAWPSSTQSSRAGDWGRPRMQHPQSDDSTRRACVVRHREV